MGKTRLDMIADTGFVSAIANERDPYRSICLPLYIRYQGFLVPESVIMETALLVGSKAGNLVVADFLAGLYVKSKFKVFPLKQEDFERAGEVLKKYHDTRLDFVDASVIAMAERFNIRTVLTIDHRDFSLVKPRHVDYLTLLPQLK